MRRLTALGVVLAMSAAAEEEAVPSPLALTLMLKVLTYDAEFGKHGQGDFVVLISGDGDAARAVLDDAERIEQKAIVGRKLSFVVVAPGELEKRAGELRAAAVIVPRGTSAAVVHQIARLGGAARLYTLALDAAHVDLGMVLGVGLNGGKPQPVINVTAARAAGVDFKPTVLKVARTVQ